MRFIYIDRVDEFLPNEYLKGRYVLPRSLVFPCGRPDAGGPSPSLLLEVLAQGGGWLIKKSTDFNVLGIMAVIKDFRLHRPIPSSGTLYIYVQTIPGSDKLVGVTGKLSLSEGEVVASVGSILYVLVPAEGRALDWGKEAWAVLSGNRELKIAKDNP